MKVKWMFITPAMDGFDIIVRDTGADNGDVLAEASVRGEDFERFIDEILLQGADRVSFGKPEKEELPQATSEDWMNEPEKGPQEEETG